MWYTCKKTIWYASILFFSDVGFLAAQTPEISLVSGMSITQSCRVRSNTYVLPGSKSDVFEPPTDLRRTAPVLVISGTDITVDFQGAELNGAPAKQLPNQFYGLGILIKGKNIVLKNAKIRGFKLAILADSIAGLVLENCDVSYNYRPKLYSGREHEAFSDWLSYHQNERDEWLRFGAGIYLRHCERFTVKGCRATGNQNALLLNGCNNGLVYNNMFHFNSGLGIGLYRSSFNRLMHNKLDWNVRGYSHRFYQRGQDSAGILAYEQSSHNLIAFNSATHSGDGFFLWAGQSTMDTGKGGCNDNWLYGNDFSYAATNGIEVTFSRNRIQGNRIENCTYGIWGGYSYETVMQGNLISKCETGIAIEHGQNDTVTQNLLDELGTGIRFWARSTQPSDWGYANNRDVSSRDHIIDRNVFHNNHKPLHISASQNVSVNGENTFVGFDTLLENPKSNAGLKFLRNDLYAPAPAIETAWKNTEISAARGVNFSHADQQPKDLYAPLMIPVMNLREPDSLPDGLATALSDGFPQGRPFIMIGEWGPFDFRRPIATLDTMAGNQYSLALIGPSGDWKIMQMRGVKNVSLRKGKLPAVLTVERNTASDEIFIAFEYSGPQTITTIFGEKIPPGKPYAFQFARFEKKLNWEVRFFHPAQAGDSLANEAAFARARKQPPVAKKNTQDLWFAWWGSPAEAVPEDQFGTVSTTTFTIAAGEYTLSLTADDGARLFLDGKRMIDHWKPHEAATDEITVKLGGRHTIEIEQYDAGGFSTLDFRMKRTRE